MIVYKLTEEQKDLLINQEYTPDNYFNPIQDIDGNWIITQEEINLCTNSNFLWVNTLEYKLYKPRIID